MWTNEHRMFGPLGNAKSSLKIFIAVAIAETLISITTLLSGGAWWNWLGLLFWGVVFVYYKLYRNHVAYGMTKLQYSTWDALRELSEQTQTKVDINKEMIKVLTDDELYAVRKSFWELRRVELENIKVVNSFRDRKTVLTASIDRVSMDLQQSTDTMRELMRHDYDDIDAALTEAESISKA